MNAVVDHAAYFKRYRSTLQLGSQGSAKEFLSAKDIVPGIDYQYIDALIGRIRDLIGRVNAAIYEEYRRSDCDAFCEEAIAEPYAIIKKHSILPRLNNQGRRPEQVLFSWLRGYATQLYFTPAIGSILEVNQSAIRLIGQDDLRSPETFRRTPTADLEVTIHRRAWRIEVQSGFQGVNDVKEHKVRQARRLREEHDTPTLCIHFDLYNGQMAIKRLDTIPDDSLNWVTRQQMEGQTVFALDQNDFAWRLLDIPPERSELEIDFES